MNDQDYIRAAVALADGWQYQQIYFAYLPGCDDAHHLGSQVVLDALAAQLVRQVDATDCEVCTGQDHAEIYNQKTQETELIFRGGNRTMNTIKVIVDSKVLE